MNSETKEKYSSIAIITAVLVTSALYAFLLKQFQLFYDLNDDALIAGIISGSYTGTPDAHCIQMLYPVSWLLKRFYMINPKFPWMGVFEIVLMWACMVLLFARTQTLLEEHISKKKYKIISTVVLYIAGIAFSVGCFLWEMVMLQYTVVCGMLAATAAYLVLTSDGFEISDNLASAFLVILAFNIRTEMLLLMCPFIAVVGICKWIGEGISLYTLKKYMSYLGIIIAGMVISYGINAYAYNGEQWKEFNEFFDARTEVYDFTGIPAYQENTAFYESKFVNEYEYDRMVDYNYVLAPRVNTALLNDIAEYAKANRTNKTSLPWAIFENVKSMLIWKLPSARLKMSDATSAFYEEGQKLHIPYNMIIIILYTLAVICAVVTKDIKWAYSLPLCVLMRFVSWGYIVYRGRVNARIAHPLYFIEIIILVGMLLMAWCESDYIRNRDRKVATVILYVGFFLCTILSGIYMHTAVKDDVVAKTQIRNSNNEMRDIIYEYTATHPRNYFLLDVYSTVGFTEELFEDAYYSRANVQLAGGWAANSPLDAQKQEHYPDKEDWLFIAPEKLDDSWAEIDILESADGKERLYVYTME